jgi:hypothetical protein
MFFVVLSILIGYSIAQSSQENTQNFPPPSASYRVRSAIQHVSTQYVPVGKLRQVSTGTLCLKNVPFCFHVPVRGIKAGSNVDESGTNPILDKNKVRVRNLRR